MSLEENTLEDATVLYTASDGVATILLNRPSKRNAIDEAMFRTILQYLSRAEQDDDVKVILLAAEGPTFCSGFDLSDPGRFFGDGAGFRHGISAMRDRAELMRKFFYALKPTVAKVQGDCIGVGFYFVLLADLAVVSTEASFGLPEERFGAAGTSWVYGFLASQVGLKVANELMLSGRRIGAAEAQQLRLVNRVVPDDQLESATGELCQAIASLPREGIAVGRATAHLTYDALGLDKSFTAHYAMLPYIAAMQRSDDEFDFHQTIRDLGLRAAVAERDRTFGGDYWRW